MHVVLALRGGLDRWWGWCCWLPRLFLTVGDEDVALAMKKKKGGKIRLVLKICVTFRIWTAEQTSMKCRVSEVWITPKTLCKRLGAVGWKCRGLGRSEFEPGGQAEQIWSRSILGLSLFGRSGRCWLVSRVPGRVHLKCKIFFWLIKVRSNESDVEQVQRGYCNYGENDSAACDEKWRAFFCVVKQARGWEGVVVVGVRSVRSHPNRNQTTTNHACNISRKMP